MVGHKTIKQALSRVTVRLKQTTVQITADKYLRARVRHTIYFDVTMRRGDLGNIGRDN